MKTRLRILVAEDDPDDIDLLRIAFERAQSGAELSFVRHGDELIRYLARSNGSAASDADRTPGLILLDLKMPCVDGFEALEWISRQPQLKRIPVVVCSGSNHPIDIQRAYDMGAKRYFVKPNRLEDLVQVVRNLEKLWARHEAEMKTEATSMCCASVPTAAQTGASTSPRG